MSENARTIAKLLEPLIIQAEKEGKWLVCSYQGISFSPEELRKENANGKFCWGPVNWRLVYPEDLMRNPKLEAAAAERHNENIRKRMGK